MVILHLTMLKLNSAIVLLHFYLHTDGTGCVFLLETFQLIVNIILYIPCGNMGAYKATIDRKITTKAAVVVFVVCFW